MVPPAGSHVALVDIQQAPFPIMPQKEMMSRGQIVWGGREAAAAATGTCWAAGEERRCRLSASVLDMCQVLYEAIGGTLVFAVARHAGGRHGRAQG